MIFHLSYIPNIHIHDTQSFDDNSKMFDIRIDDDNFNLKFILSRLLYRIDLYCSSVYYIRYIFIHIVMFCIPGLQIDNCIHLVDSSLDIDIRNHNRNILRNDDTKLRNMYKSHKISYLSNYSHQLYIDVPNMNENNNPVYPEAEYHTSLIIEINIVKLLIVCKNIDTGRLYNIPIHVHCSHCCNLHSCEFACDFIECSKSRDTLPELQYSRIIIRDIINARFIKRKNESCQQWHNYGWRLCLSRCLLNMLHLDHILLNATVVQKHHKKHIHNTFSQLKDPFKQVVFYKICSFIFSKSIHDTQPIYRYAVNCHSIFVDVTIIDNEAYILKNGELIYSDINKFISSSNCLCNHTSYRLMLDNSKNLEIYRRYDDNRIPICMSSSKYLNMDINDWDL